MSSHGSPRPSALRPAGWRAFISWLAERIVSSPKSRVNKDIAASIHYAKQASYSTCINNIYHVMHTSNSGIPETPSRVLGLSSVHYIHTLLYSDITR